MFWKQGNKAVYRKSNSINDTLFQPNNVATHYTKKPIKSKAYIKNINCQLKNCRDRIVTIPLYNTFLLNK